MHFCNKIIMFAKTWILPNIWENFINKWFKNKFPNCPENFSYIISSTFHVNKVPSQLCYKMIMLTKPWLLRAMSIFIIALRIIRKSSQMVWLRVNKTIFSKKSRTTWVRYKVHKWFFVVIIFDRGGGILLIRNFCSNERK